MKVYFGAFINFKQNNWAKLLSMAKFAYNNDKNASISYIPIELNCSYHLKISFEKDIGFCFKSKLADKLS